MWLWFNDPSVFTTWLDQSKKGDVVHTLRRIPKTNRSIGKETKVIVRSKYDPNYRQPAIKTFLMIITSLPQLRVFWNTQQYPEIRTGFLTPEKWWERAVELNKTDEFALYEVRAIRGE
ncbi:MAG: hypothetical protein HXX80_07420 [Nitrososphaerales archaeon]|nr:hypothetical protein [Nitrososphaerales archaeon]